MKKKIIIIIIFVLGIVLIGLGVFNLIMDKRSITKERPKIYKVDFDDKISLSDESKAITICKEGTKNCPHALNEALYNIIKYDYDNDYFQKNVVDKYNKAVLKIYNDTISSTKYPGNCKLGDIFNYYDVTTIDPGLHENSMFISFSIIPRETNYCTMKTKALKPIAFNYSKDKNKILSITEFMSMLGISENKLKIALSERVNNYNQIHETQYTYEELIDDSDKYRELFFVNNGELDLSFYNKVDKEYDIAVVYKDTEFLIDNETHS